MTLAEDLVVGALFALLLSLFDAHFDLVVDCDDRILDGSPRRFLCFSFLLVGEVGDPFGDSGLRLDEQRRRIPLVG